MSFIIDKEESDKIEFLLLRNEFEDLFSIRVEPDMYWMVFNRLSSYVGNIRTEREKEFLEAFVKAYFELKGVIVDNRNSIMGYRQSEQYKRENIINKLKIRNEFKYWQGLCEDLNIFEEDFYLLTNISLLSVENARHNKEQSFKKLCETADDLFVE